MEGGLSHPTSSSTWSNIIMAGIKIEEENVNFRNSFSRQIGIESTTSFWNEIWIGSSTLRVLFPRLFRLENQQESRICDRIRVSNSGLTYNWDWSRNPTGRTNSELSNLIRLLNGFAFSNSNSDSWCCTLATNGIFSVNRLTKLIDEQQASSNSDSETLRNNLAPKKLEVFVWRLLKRRLPARIELDKRGIDLHSVRCPLCDDGLETVEHTFIFCKHAMDLWERVFGWWNLGHFNNLSLNELLRGNTSNQSSSFGKKVWQSVEWVCAYYIWKIRNNLVFRDKKGNIPVALNEIQIKFFEWITHRSKGKKFDWHIWLSNPSFYLTN
ncbi:uncharacterized protein [Rutidosis leptorrhynchoides]|uniref:uncharacterized protein n=1 Tax=Rutidosis leptorrhynchoides TaxID=125765 RepID=UPI003A993454